MDLKSKLEKFQKSIMLEADKQYNQKQAELENEIKTSIEQELLEYGNKKNSLYEKNIQKIEKSFNKKIFNYEVKCKKEYLEEEKKFKIQIKKDAIELLKIYTQREEYKSYLIKTIEERNI